jgi:hypothetical protein
VLHAPDESQVLQTAQQQEALQRDGSCRVGSGQHCQLHVAPDIVAAAAADCCTRHLQLESMGSNAHAWRSDQQCGVAASVDVSGLEMFCWQSMRPVWSEHIAGLGLL